MMRTCAETGGDTHAAASGSSCLWVLCVHHMHVVVVIVASAGYSTHTYIHTHTHVHIHIHIHIHIRTHTHTRTEKRTNVPIRILVGVFIVCYVRLCAWRTMCEAAHCLNEENTESYRKVKQRRFYSC
jgi:hypothetical protein